MNPHLSPDYKQTELGVIPEEWRTSTIQDLLDRGVIVSHLDGNHGELYPRSDEFKESGVPYITANDLCGHRVSFNNCKFLSEERARRFRKGVAKSGDVLFAHNATVGPTALLKTDLDYVILSTTATYFRCDQEKLLNSYLLYAIQASPFVAQYRAVMAQSTRNQVPITAQRKLSIAIPSTKAEQKAIAEALSDADALIESLEQLVAKKRNLKQGTMQELLTGKKRLPGFSGEWEIKRLGDLAEIQRGASPRPIDDPIWFDESSIIGWVRISDVTRSGKYLKETTQRLSALGVRHSRPVYQGSLIMSICATVGRPVITEIDVCIHDGFVVFDNLQCDKHFMYHFLKSIEGDWSRHGQTGSQMNLNTALINGTAIPVPCLEEQIAIAAVLSDMDAEIAELETQLVKTRSLKQGMMHKLLTGEIRLL
jgi:type I restriction enzyme, S subunit